MSVTNLQDIHTLTTCHECNGEGRYEADVERPHATGYNEGYIDTEWVDCEECFGTGEIYLLCTECEEPLVATDGKNATVCRECKDNV